ncbi:serine/threonine-protein kinase [Nocardia sp. NPDC051832]|uniref:serine/threonine-protein kinase n=1 Tax=Nocardia sp. NPDC051832 TaxID=3155673 RepID=UPI00342D5B84
MTADRLIAGRYRLTDPIGTGAMGVVWRATDVRLRRTVAVKQLILGPGLSRSAALEAKLRAMREGRIAARLHHPNAITVFDVAEEDGQPWLVMEYMNAPSLAAKLSGRQTLPPEEVARIGAQAAAALSAAHEAGIMHRDVKPANLLVADDGTVKITDFGISRAVGDVTVTATGFLAGTPAYLAPEVARGENPEPASDVFALGSTLYAALEGSPPFGEGDNPLAVLHSVARGEIPPPKQAGELGPVLLRLLAPGIDARPTMREAREALEAVAAGRVPALAAVPISTKVMPAPGGDATTVLAAPGPDADGATEFIPAPAAQNPTPPPPPARSSDTLRGGAGDGGPSKQTLALVAVAAAAVLLAAFLLWTRNSGEESPQVAQQSTTAEPAAPSSSLAGGAPVQREPQNPPSSTTTPPPSSSTTTPPSSTTTTPPTTTPAGPPTPEKVGQFIQGYYSMLPGNVDGAWAQLAPAYQAQTGGYAAYSSWWRTIRSVSVSNVTPSGDGATATINYVKANGQRDSETRWFRVSSDGGRLLITASST